MLMRNLFTSALAVLLITGCASTPKQQVQSPEAETLAGFIQRHMTTARIPGLTACIVKDGEARWAEGFGLANVESNALATPDTLFQLGSVAKAITAVAVLQACESGVCQLDDDVNAFLPFALRNPAFADKPITLRSLLAHTSSLRDDPDLYASLYTISAGGGDSPIGLEEFLRGYLTPGGQWYDPKRCFLPAAPETQFAHSNVGYAVLGLAVERAAGVPFDRFCAEHIFAPLGMTNTHWFLRDADPANIAMPYKFDVQTQTFNAYGHYGFPTWPDGQLRASARDYARFLAAIMDGGALGEVRILSRASVEEMATIQYPEANPDLGLAWWYGAIANQEAIGLDGRDPGVCTSAFYVRGKRIGIVIFTNSDCTVIGDQARYAIQERLLKEAEKL